MGTAKMTGIVSLLLTLAASLAAAGTSAVGVPAEALETLVVLGRQMPESEMEAHGPAAMTELADRLRREGFTLHQEGRVVFAFSPGVLPAQRMANNLLKARTIARLAGPDRTFSLRDEPELRQRLSGFLESTFDHSIADGTKLGIEAHMELQLTSGDRSFSVVQPLTELSRESREALRSAPLARSNLSMEERMRLATAGQEGISPHLELLRAVEAAVVGKGSGRALTRRILLGRGLEVLAANLLEYRTNYVLAYDDLRRLLDVDGAACPRGLKGASFEDLPSKQQRLVLWTVGYPFDFQRHGFGSAEEARAFAMGSRVNRAHVHLRIIGSSGPDQTGSSVGIAVRLPPPP
jgi:hypothetical protein